MGNIKSFCCRDGLNAEDDQDERARIISDQYPSSNSLYNNSQNSGQDTTSYGSMEHGGGAGKTMEQSALDKIYQKMAANVIDVAPGESMVIQPAEFTERQLAYQTRLNQIKTQLPLRSNNSRVTKHISGSNIDAVTRVNTSVVSVGNSSNWAKVGQIGGNTSMTNSIGQNASIAISNAATTSSGSPQHISKSQEKRRVGYEPISNDDIQLINEISKRTVKAIKGLKINSHEQVVTHFQP